MKKIVASFSMMVLGVSSLAGMALPLAVSADSGPATYGFLIAADPLCDLFPGECPAVARADNGDTVSITGSGSLSIHPKSVTGGGTFVHKNAAGDVLVSGTWIADKLLSFNGYGCGSGDPFPTTFCGGQALIAVTLWVSGTPVAHGVLQVDCLIGKPPAGAAEGVRLAVKETGLNFNKEEGGVTLFITE